MSGIDDTRVPFAVGDLVRVTGIPPGVDTMPEDSRCLFARIVGRTLRVDEVADWGDLVLNALADGSQSPDWNAHTLWLPPAFADLVTPDTRNPIPQTRP